MNTDDRALLLDALSALHHYRTRTHFLIGVPGWYKIGYVAETAVTLADDVLAAAKASGISFPAVQP